MKSLEAKENFSVSTLYANGLAPSAWKVESYKQCGAGAVITSSIFSEIFTKDTPYLAR